MTLMNEVIRGRLPEEVVMVADQEGINPGKLAKLISNGNAVIIKNPRRKIKPLGIGQFLTTKVNINVGTSGAVESWQLEKEKALAAIDAGSDTIMDLSIGGDLDQIRCKLLESLTVPIGTVPIYQAAVNEDLTSQGMFNALEKQAKDGVDFVTVHAGVNKNSLERLKLDPRVLGIVSRGGSLTVKYIMETGQENPYYAEFDYLLDIAKEYDITLSLGDGLRPGCIEDASDRAKFMEFVTLGELVQKSRQTGVQAMVEGPGHVPANEIETSVRAMKNITNDAPLYLLGPLVTDIAPAYDHITAAIGGVIAGMAGADFLCATTPSEHLDLPTIDDIVEGTYVTRIAAHAADLTRIGVEAKAKKLDLEMAKARADLDWERQFRAAINPRLARQIRHRRGIETDTCTMCNELCAIKLARESLDKKA